MTLEIALNYVTHHSESIIQWVFLAILLLSGFLIARGVFGKKEAASASATPDVTVTATAAASPELQAALEKIMSQTAKLEAVQLQGLSPAAVADVDGQVQALKKDLASREEEINRLKEEGKAKPAEDAGKLSERIKELEAKLAEYEILEDDIADLSLYKEENTRLKSELDKIRAGGAAAPAPASAPVEAAVAAGIAAAAAPAPAPVPAVALETSSEALMAEFAQAVSHDPGPSAAASAPEPLAIPDTGNPMADFESTVQLERKLTSAPGAVPTNLASVDLPPPSQPAPPAAPAPEADDLFAEFAAPPPAGAGASAADNPIESSTLDTDKMLEEMASLVSMEPSHGNALEDAIDIEKMALEAGKKA